MKYTIRDFLDKQFVVRVTEAEWPEFVKLMRSNGVELTDHNRENVTDCGGYCYYDGMLVGERFRTDPPRIEFRDLFPYTPADFFTGRIGVRSDTKEQYDRLMRECEAKGLRWNHGSRPTAWRVGMMPVSVFARNGGNALTWGGPDRKDSVPFSTLFPADLWAEFVAGRCYLRVTKEEWAEFAKRVVSAGIMWASGRDPRDWHYFGSDADYVAQIALDHGKKCLFGTASEAPNYTKPIHPLSAIARPEAVKPDPQPYDGRGKHKVGDRFEVLPKESSGCYTDHSTFKAGDIVQLHNDDGTEYPWFKRVSDGAVEYSLWKRMKPAAPLPRIEITTDGRVTTATLYEGEKAVKTETVDGTTDFEKGARIAFSRLIPGTVRELRVRVNVDTSALDAALQSVHDALSDLPNRIKAATGE